VEWNFFLVPCASQINFKRSHARVETTLPTLPALKFPPFEINVKGQPDQEKPGKREREKDSEYIFAVAATAAA